MTGKLKARLTGVLAVLAVLALVVHWPSDPDPKSPDMDERLAAVKELHGLV